MLFIFWIREIWNRIRGYASSPFGGRYNLLDDVDWFFFLIRCPKSAQLGAYLEGKNEDIYGRPVNRRAIFRHLQVCKHCSQTVVEIEKFFKEEKEEKKGE